MGGRDSGRDFVEVKPFSVRDREGRDIKAGQSLGQLKPGSSTGQEFWEGIFHGLKLQLSVEGLHIILRAA